MIHGPLHASSLRYQDSFHHISWRCQEGPARHSAHVHARFDKYRRVTGAAMDMDSYVRLLQWDEGKDPSQRPKAPRPFERSILEYGPAEVAQHIHQWGRWEVGQLTQACSPDAGVRPMPNGLCRLAKPRKPARTCGSARTRQKRRLDTRKGTRGPPIVGSHPTCTAPPGRLKTDVGW